MNQRSRIVAVVLALIPLGLAIKYYTPAPFDAWASRHGAAILYEIFWVLAAGLQFPRAPALRIAMAVCAITCALEGLQLWHPAWLEALRATRLGAALLGTTFDPRDFVYYFAGSSLGALVLGALRRQGSVSAGTAS